MPSLIPMRSIRMDDEVYLKVKFIAEKETRSFNQQVVCVLKQFVSDYENAHEKIIVDVDELYK